MAKKEIVRIATKRKIVRLDAYHEADGAFTRFFEKETDARGLAQELINVGWDVDYYFEDVWGGNRLKLLLGVWPNAPTDELLNLRRRVPALVNKPQASHH